MTAHEAARDSPHDSPVFSIFHSKLLQRLLCGERVRNRTVQHRRLLAPFSKYEYCCVVPIPISG